MNIFCKRKPNSIKRSPLLKKIYSISKFTAYPIVKCISEAHSDLLLKSNITSSSSLESFFCVSAMQNCVLWMSVWVEKYYYSWVPFHWGCGWDFFFLRSLQYPNPKSSLEQIWRLIWVHNCAQLYLIFDLLLINFWVYPYSLFGNSQKQKLYYLICNL